MTEELRQAIPVVLILVFVTSLIFWKTWKIIGWCLIAFLHVAKWTFVACMVVAITCGGYTYRALGWTPLSLVFGNEIYDETLRVNFKEKPNGEKISSRAVRAR